MTIQLPFDNLSPRHIQFGEFNPNTTLPTTRSVLSAENAIIIDLHSLDGQIHAIAINFQANDPSSIQWGERKITVPSKPLTFISLAP